MDFCGRRYHAGYAGSAGGDLDDARRKKAAVVFQSNGGDRDAAFAMGRMIRAAGLETSIGRTRLPNCPKLDPRCKSSIAKADRPRAKSLPAVRTVFRAVLLSLWAERCGLSEIRRSASSGRRQAKDTDREDFYAYFNEMGVSPETYETMMTRRSNGEGDILPSQALGLGIINGIIPYDEEPGAHFCGPEAKESLRCPRKSEAEIVPAAASVN